MRLFISLTMLTFLFYFKLFLFVNGISTINQSNAMEYCSSHGGLISYHTITGCTECILDKENLKEQESVWIQGYANFSKFLHWHGCYAESDIRLLVNARKVLKNNIYNCSSLCNLDSKTSVVIIGLNEDRCYCMHLVKLGTIKPYQDEECQPQMLEPTYSYGNASSEFVRMYSVVDDGYLKWYEEATKNFGQCVSIKKTGKNEKYGKQSCIEKKDALICVSSVKRELNQTCSMHHDGSSSHCVISNVSTDWLQAAEHCKKYLGKLSSYVTEAIKHDLTEGTVYWTGIFRSYQIVNKEQLHVPESQIPCLAVTKIDDNLVVHPDNCSVEKKALCAKTYITETTKHDDIVTTVTEDVYNKVSDDPTTSKKLSTPEPLNIAVLIGVCVGVIISLLLIAICIVHLIKRKKNKPTKEKQDNVNEYNCEVGENTYASVDKNAKAQKTLNTEPEKSFKNINDTSGKDSGSEMPNYDRVELPSGQGHKQPTASLSVGADVHVYGYHSGAHADKNDVYDHLGDQNKQKSESRTGEYSTMRDVLTDSNAIYGVQSGSPVQVDDKNSAKEGVNSLYDKLS